MKTTPFQHHECITQTSQATGIEVLVTNPSVTCTLRCRVSASMTAHRPKPDGEGGLGTPGCPAFHAWRLAEQHFTVSDVGHGVTRSRQLARRPTMRAPRAAWLLPTRRVHAEMPSGARNRKM